MLVSNILEVLYDRRGQFVAPDELAPSAGATAGELASAVAELERRGHRIERAAPRGVRLVAPTVLDAHLLERDLSVEQIGRHVICFDEVDSTNDVAFDSAGADGAQQAAHEALVVTAEHQRAGRGRLGRQWICPRGTGILAGVLLAGGRQPASDPLTIAAGLAVAEGITQATGVRTQLEWPNDVAADGEKLAGVLVETRGPRGSRRTVIGFGINVTAAPPPEAVHRPATSLADAGAATLERIEILRAVLVRLDHWIGEVRADRTDGLHDAWVERCQMLNRRVTVQSEGRKVVGRILDVSPLDGLVLAADTGEQLHLPAAVSSVEQWG